MIKFLIEKEFKQLARNPFILCLVIALPCVVMLLFPWATTMEIKHMSLSVVDNDHSAMSRRLIGKIASTDYFDITGNFPDTDIAMESIEYGKSDIIIEIPPDFEKSLTEDRHAVIMVSANAVNATKASMGISYLSMITDSFAAETGLEGSGSGIDLSGGVEISPYYRFNPLLDYKIPMIPALMVLVLTLLCGFLPAMNIVGEKETGTIEQINVTPVPKLTFIVGKLIPYWIIGVVAFSLAILVSYLVFGLVPAGSLILLYGVAFIYIFGISALGLIISNYSNTMQQAMFMIFFFIVIIILMSGIFTPVSSMPEWARAIARVNPLTYFADIIKSIYLKGSSLKDVQNELYALLAFFVFIIAWAVFSYRKRE